MTGPIATCPVCGGTAFKPNAVLWDRLIADWQLAPAEVAYLDRQQGYVCLACGSVLRAMALGAAILRCLGQGGPLTRALDGDAARRLRVLEINRVAGLSDVIAALPRYRQVAYPAIDLMALDLPDASVDLVLHSDTLEHVAEPRRALAECRRVLAPGGFCCFTVPVVVGRLTRSRAGLPNSYHGAPGIELEDFVVRYEFGADVWTHVLEAGFTACELVSVDYPGGVAIKAQR